MNEEKCNEMREVKCMKEERKEVCDREMKLEMK